jgi:hypothetical protein
MFGVQLGKTGIGVSVDPAWIAKKLGASSDTELVGLLAEFSNQLARSPNRADFVKSRRSSALFPHEVKR